MSWAKLIPNPYVQVPPPAPVLLPPGRPLAPKITVPEPKPPIVWPFKAWITYVYFAFPVRFPRLSYKVTCIDPSVPPKVLAWLTKSKLKVKLLQSVQQDPLFQLANWGLVI